MGGGGGDVECEADHSLPSSAEIKNVWSYTSIPTYLHDIHRDNFTFTFTLKERILLHILNVALLNLVIRLLKQIQYEQVQRTEIRRV
jgi:hypothetical protein